MSLIRWTDYGALLITFFHLYSFPATGSHLPVINDWIKQKLYAVTASSNRGYVFACWQLPAGMCTGDGVGSGLFIMSASNAEIEHLHTRETAQLPPGWQSLRWHVWGPAAWRWPEAVCSLRSVACCPSRWAPHSHFLRSWLEVGSPPPHSASSLSPLLMEKWKCPFSIEECV